MCFLPSVSLHLRYVQIRSFRFVFLSKALSSNDFISNAVRARPLLQPTSYQGAYITPGHPGTSQLPDGDNSFGMPSTNPSGDYNSVQNMALPLSPGFSQGNPMNPGTGSGIVLGTALRGPPTQHAYDHKDPATVKQVSGK